MCEGLEYLWDDREESSNTNASLEYLSVEYCSSLTSLSLNGQLPTTLSTLCLTALDKFQSTDANDLVIQNKVSLKGFPNQNRRMSLLD